MMQNKRWTEAHARYCAARNWRTSFFLLLFCVFETLVCWRELGKPLPDNRASIVLLVGYTYVVLLLVQFMLSFRCLRERVVLALGISSFLKAILVGVAPGLAGAHVRFVRDFSFLLWAAASLTSLSLFYSALRMTPHRKESESTGHG